MVERCFAILPYFHMSVDCLAVGAVAVSAAQNLMEIEGLDEMLLTDVFLEAYEGMILDEVVNHSCCGKEAFRVVGSEGDLVKGVELNRRAFVVILVKGEWKRVVRHYKESKTGNLDWTFFNLR